MDKPSQSIAIELPYELAEAALILLDVSVDQSGIDAAELESQRLQVVQALRDACGVDNVEDAQDDAPPVGRDGGADDAAAGDDGAADAGAGDAV